jgi:hypothetical protein
MSMGVLIFASLCYFAGQKILLVEKFMADKYNMTNHSHRTDLGKIFGIANG